MKLKTREPFLMLPSPSPSHSVHLSLIFPTVSFPSGATVIPPAELCNHSWFSLSCSPPSHRRSFSEGGLALRASCPLSFPPPAQVGPCLCPAAPALLPPPHLFLMSGSPVPFNQQRPCLQLSTRVHDDCLPVGAFAHLWCYF